MTERSLGELDINPDRERQGDVLDIQEMGEFLLGMIEDSKGKNQAIAGFVENARDGVQRALNRLSMLTNDETRYEETTNTPITSLLHDVLSSLHSAFEYVVSQQRTLNGESETVYEYMARDLRRRPLDADRVIGSYNDYEKELIERFKQTSSDTDK